MIKAERNNPRWSVSTNDLPMQKKHDYMQQVLPDDLGVGYSNFFQLDQGLNYIETRYSPCKDLSLTSQNENNESRLVVTLGLKGCSRFAADKGDEVVFNEGYTTITSFNSSIGERQYKADKELQQLRFSLSKTCLNKYFGEKLTDGLFKNKSVHTLSYQPISPQGLMTVQHLLTSNVPRDTRLIYMHGQALSVLASELSHLFENKAVDKSKYNNKDKEIARSARDILFTEFKNPPSVNELAKRVGANQLKLKKLFHHFFNTTPYGLLLEIRMNTAYQLLESTQCHVSVAADYVGYHHASNFSAAFVKFFGIPPKYVSRKTFTK